MVRWRWKILKESLKALGYGALFTFFAAIALAVYILDSRPDLSFWHTEVLPQEFDQNSEITTLAQYFALERALFAALDARTAQASQRDPANKINRYDDRSLASPKRWPQDWNRSFEVTPDNPDFGIVLLHGLSDSPYSLRDVHLAFYQHNAYQLGLRLPGHGTMPSALTQTSWQDMYAATELAMRHAKAKLGDKPLYVVGYSTGGSLIIHYILQQLKQTGTTDVTGLAMISPAIATSKVAMAAQWQERLGSWLGLEKLAWNSISIEYNPYKYGSFAINAGNQIYQLSLANQALLANIKQQQPELLADFPATLSFQSVADSTILPSAVLSQFYDYLPAPNTGQHELVLFDINRYGKQQVLLKREPLKSFERYLNRVGNAPHLAIHLITNIHSDSREMALKSYPDTSAQTPLLLPYSWPSTVYSLSHVALSFAYNDPLYGALPSVEQQSIHIGSMALSGEIGLIHIGSASMLRQKWNPAQPWLVNYLVNRLQPAI
ncbi:alpha/beta hydrolase [Motilimonas pumila]|uniref:alpha/beta hydrolase n=1 Tax=Motilimonas pumila TaxID=2303987 RepID=UPI0013149C2E|nr:alpha/beta fold hydrolase [Motilimonas pumila]